VPIHYYARSRADGKKLTWRDGLAAVVTLIRLRMTTNRRLFGSAIDQPYHRRRQLELSRQHPLARRSEAQSER
jgi:hypothetical protein